MFKPKLAAVCTLVLLAAANAQAHELFLIFRDASTSASERTVAINNGTFHESAATVSRDRLRDISIHQNGKKVSPDVVAWNEVGKQTRLLIRPPGRGTLLLGISSKGSSSTRSASEFAEYLKLGDLPDTLASYDPARYPRGVTYRYTKHARAITQVGDDLTDDYAASLGYPLEIRMDRHPGRLAVGERLSFQVLHAGEPAPGLRVYVGSAATRPSRDGHDDATLLRTDGEGRASFDVTATGVWYIHANRFVPSQQDGVDFVSDRASLTFEVPRGR